MEVYTFSEARQNFASILDHAKKQGSVLIKKRDGQSFISKRNERSELVHFRMSAGNARFNTPRLAAEWEPCERLRVQGLPWGMIPFIITPESKDSPLNVKGIDLNLSRDEIVGFIREGRV